jgi:hypothetical protein
VQRFIGQAKPKNSVGLHRKRYSIRALCGHFRNLEPLAKDFCIHFHYILTWLGVFFAFHSANIFFPAARFSFSQVQVNPGLAHASTLSEHSTKE